MRLAKAIARAGVCSRRKAEQYIKEGQVSVNGEVVRDPSTKVDPQRDRIKLKGRTIKPPAPPVYILMYKPRGIITTLHDPQGRPTVRDLLKGLKARVFPVGRLDFNAEGLLLLTNDGDVANRMMHPRYGVKRIYLVKVKGIPSEQVLKEARKGIVLQDGVRVTPSLSIHRRLRSNAWIKVEIAEGRHHEVRQIFDHLGMRVLRLKRVAYGPLELGALRPGESRPLTPAEVDRLRESLGLSR